MNLLLSLVLIFIFSIIFLVVLLLINHVEAYKIMTVGDMSCNADSLKVMNRTLSHLKQNTIDRFVFLGDAQSNSYYNCVRDFFKKVSNYTELRILRGNHEGPATWANITETFNVSTTTVPYEKIGNVLLVYMNSEIPYIDQYTKVGDVLSNSAKHKIVFVHKTALSGTCKSLSPSTQLMCGFYEKYNPMFKDKGVDCVVQAHQHTMAIFERFNMLYGLWHGRSIS